MTRTISRYLFRLFFWTVSLVAIVFFSGISILQTKSFQSWLKNEIETRFAEETNGRLEIWKLRIRFPIEVLLEHPRLIIDGDKRPALVATRVSVSVDFFQTAYHIIRGSQLPIVIDECLISNPSLRLIQSDEGRLNFSRLIKESDDTTATRLPFLAVKALRLENGSVIWHKRLGLAPDDEDSRSLKAMGLNPINYSDLRFTHFTLHLSLDMKDTHLSGLVKECHFRLVEGDFELSEARGFFSLSHQRFDLLAFRLQSTLSEMLFSASLALPPVADSLSLQYESHSLEDVFTSLERATLSIEAESKRFSMVEIQPFLPQLYPLRGILSMQLRAHGTTDSLMISNALLSDGSSSVSLSGAIWNMTHDRPIEYAVTSSHAEINFVTLPALLPTFSLESLSHLGSMSFNLSGSGTANASRWDISGRSDFGNLKTQCDLTHSLERLEFSGKIDVTEGDLSIPLREEKIKTSLNFGAKVKGSYDGKKGISIDLSGQLLPSLLFDQVIDTALIDFYFDTKQLRTGLYVLSGAEELSLLFDVNFSQNTPTFLAQGNLMNVNLGRWLANDSLETNLNFRYFLEGESFDLKRLNLKSTITFDTSSFGTFLIPSGTSAALVVLQKDTYGSISLRSSVLDAELDGHLNLEDLNTILTIEVGRIAFEIDRNTHFQKDRFFENDSLQNVLTRQNSLPLSALFPKGTVPPLPNNTRENPVPIYPSQQFSFEFRLKSISELAPVFRSEAFNGSGKISGSFYSESSGIHIQSNVSIDSAGYSRLFDIRRFEGELTYRNSAEVNNDALIIFSPFFSLSGSSQRVSSGVQDFFRTAFSLSYSTYVLGINIRTTNANTNSLLDLVARGINQNGNYILDIDQFTFATRDYFWEMERGAHAEISPTAIRFSKFKLANDDQIILIDGLLEQSGRGKIELSVSHFQLDDIAQFLFDNPATKLEGEINLDLTIEGNLTTPEMRLSSRLDHFRYEAIEIGNLTIGGFYSNELLNVTVDAATKGAATSSKGSRTFSNNNLSGFLELPINLAFASVDERLPDRPARGELRSTDTDARTLEFFMPFLTKTQGNMTLNGQFSGTSKRLNFSLLCGLSQIRTVIYGTETPYTINGDVRVTPSKVDWSRLRFDDDNGGFALLDGQLDMDFFSPTTLSMSAIARNFTLMQKPDSRGSDFFGFLRGSSDNLRLTGTLTKPFLSGTVTLNQSDLTQYRSSTGVSEQFAEASKFISTIIVEDTIQKVRPPEDPTLNLGLQEGSQAFFSKQISSFEPGFLDLLEMNISLFSSAPFRYSLIFNRLISESLTTELESIRLRIQKKSGVYVVFGDAILSGGFYDFYATRFDLRPGSRIVWENRDLLEARLLINAGFSQLLRIYTQGITDYVEVYLKLLGTIKNPEVEIGYGVREGNPQGAEIAYKAPNTSLDGLEDPNAVANLVMLLYARQWYARPGEFTQANVGTALQGAVAGAGLSAGAGLLSAQLSRLTSQIGGIQSINIGVGRDSQGAVRGLDLSLAYNIPGTGGKLTFIGAATNLGSAINEQINDPLNPNAQVGSSNLQRLEYQFNRSIVFEAYRAENAAQFNTFNQNNPTVWGFSVGYRENFRSWNEFFNRWENYFKTFFGVFPGDESISNEPLKDDIRDTALPVILTP